MKTLIEAAGWFIWPLGICSFVAVFIIVERLVALRGSRIIPDVLLDLLAQGRVNPLPHTLQSTTGGRVILFFNKNNPDPDTLKAYAQVELTRLERGLYLLDTIVSAAPLIGLLGTVYGLFLLFPDKGMPDSDTLTRGVGMALTTTIIGLMIAIPSLTASNYIARRLEIISARVNMAVERLCALGAMPAAPAAVADVPPPLPEPETSGARRADTLP